MRSHLLFPLMFLAWVSIHAQDFCSAYTLTKGPYQYFSNADSKGHASGDHLLQHDYYGRCVYSDQISGSQGACNASAYAVSKSSTIESGKLITFGNVHETAATDVQGQADATSPNVATANAEGVGAVRECKLSCGFTVSLGGFGGTVAFSASPTWSTTHNYSNTCLAKSTKVNTCSGTSLPGAPPPINPCGPSPILIDTKNEGWHLKGFVTFNFGGKLVKVEWPDWEYENAWLVYDKNGVIDGADDLFGDFTAHANADFLGVKNHPNPTGFLALQWYDRKAQGGDGNLVLDKRDAIWKKLKLWKPKHCHLNPDQPCVALDSELFPLNFDSLSLVYEDGSDYATKAGSVCQFKALVNPEKGESQKSKDGRWACDFRLAVKP